jgi:spore coat polysaccharide biosynthesis protein SpsF
MIGIFITARLGSKRLHRKHLIKVEGKTFLEWLILRYKNMFESDLNTHKVKIILTTSEKAENKEFQEVLNKYDVEVFFGNDNNIPKRYLDCAVKYSLDFFIVVDGDDILCSPAGSHRLLKSIQESCKYDIYRIEGLPLGMNSSAYKTSYIKESLETNGDENLEIGWSRIFLEPKISKIKLGEYDIQGDLRFTLDYEDDSLFFKSIINFLKKDVIGISDSELIKTVIEKKFDKLNRHLSKEYWDNYNNSVKKQINNNE